MSVIEANWSYKINIDEIEANLYSNFELSLSSLCENVLKALEDGFLIENINFQANLAQTYDEELRRLIESNKELRQAIDLKLNQLTGKQMQYENYKKDQKLLTKEIKETHEAFLMAKKCFKKFLKIYYTIESRNKDSQVIFVQFFTEAKKDTENYTVRLKRNIKTRSYELQSIHPKLKNFKEFQKKLEENNDVPGLLCCLRQAFMTIKEAKKK
ncbi:uncharacterized protein LOC123656926 [Melitaea cinxia]|uniref:uncharacterized protein LOC123656926 n=1 Tax=Melitaea cinxia TaxID=113334 RepID=UPI001E27043D|nr:uncharacterized protein LOC123656926 [Melitaea cinxia]